MKKDSIIIIGAGISGLVAARELSTKFNVLIIEAKDAAGGRINSLYKKNIPIIWEAGAEFLHGKAPQTRRLLKQAGIKFHAAEGEMYRKGNTKLYRQHTIIAGWDKLLKKMQEQKEDSSLAKFLQKHFPGKNYASLRQQAIQYARGFDIADENKASVFALCNEWSKQDESAYRIAGGYTALVNFLVKECRKHKCRFVFKDAVKEINWKPKHVKVSLASGKSFNASKAMITVPLPVLKNTSSGDKIIFNPPVKNLAANARKIGMGNVVKIFMHFKKSFWPPDAGFILSGEKIPTFWTSLPDPVPVLTGWAGGPNAKKLSKLTLSEIKKLTIQSLAGIFNLNYGNIEENLVDFEVYKWNEISFIRGAYSYNMPGSAQAKALIKTPFLSTLYFAGEGLYEGVYRGTVEAAICSAMESVKLISQSPSH